MEDNKIIELYFKRDEDALTQTKECYGKQLNALAFRILQNKEDAEECENDTYMKAWNSMPPQRPNILSAFLGKIARNLALDRYEREHAQKRGGSQIPLILDELEECIPSGFDLETELEARELTEHINRFLADLPAEDRKLFVRRYWYSCSVTELAAITHATPNQISVRLFRIREKLRRALMKEGLFV